MRVEVEYSKKINVKKFEGDVGELKNFIFASVFESKENLAAHVLAAGLANIQQIRVEE